MAQYRTGTVTVTNGSSAVVGLDTAFAGNVSPGDLFTLPGSGVFYEVATVTDDTNLLLTANYAGPTVAGLDFIISTGFTPNFSIPEISGGDLNWPDVLTRSLRRIDAVLGDHEARLPGGPGQPSDIEARLQALENFMAEMAIFCHNVLEEV